MFSCCLFDVRVCARNRALGILRPACRRLLVFFCFSRLLFCFFTPCAIIKPAVSHCLSECKE